jgi:hypothetical protein
MRFGMSRCSKNLTVSKGALKDTELEPVELSELREQRAHMCGCLEGVGDCVEGREMLGVRHGGKVQVKRELRSTACSVGMGERMAGERRISKGRAALYVRRLSDSNSAKKDWGRRTPSRLSSLKPY